jgi:hypothetical protein
MAKKKTDETTDYSESQATEDGWVISLESEPQVVTATGTGANTEVVVRAGKYVAEKTFDSHLITAVAETKEQLLEAIAAQQASIDAAPQAAGTDRAVTTDSAGGEDGGGISSVLPETEVKLEPLEEVGA